MRRFSAEPPEQDTRGAAEKAVDGSSAPMRPISGFSSCAARSRMHDALAALLGASLGSGPPGPPNISPKVFGRASVDAHQGAAVDAQGLPGDVAGLPRAEERTRCRELVGQTVT